MKKYLGVIVLVLVLLFVVGCAKKDKPEETPQPPKSKLFDLSIILNSSEKVFLDFYTNRIGGYQYYFSCENCVVNGISYLSYGCSSVGSYKDLNAGSNRGKACFRVENTSCTHNFKGLIVSYEYSLMETSSGLYVNFSNENVWDKDCNF